MNENRHIEEVKSALKLLDIPEISLAKDVVSIFHSDMIKKFTKQGEYIFPMWENLQSEKLTYQSIQNADVWRSLGDIFAGEKMYLFFEQAEDDNVFTLSDGRVISDLLGECYLFTFYLTNENQDFLFAANEHEFVIAVGELSEKLNDFYANSQKEKV